MVLSPPWKFSTHRRTDISKGIPAEAEICTVSLLRIKQATPTNPEDTQSLLKTKRNLSRRAIGGPRSLCDLREDALLCKPFPEFLIMRVEISYSSAFAKKTGNLSSTTSHQTLKVNSKCLQNCILYLVNLKQTEY